MRSRSLFLFSLLFLFTLVTFPAGAQTAQPQTDLQQQVTELQKLIRKLQERVDQLSQSSTAGAPQQNAAASQEQLEVVDQKLRILERTRELEQEDAAAKAKETPFVTAGRDGFSISSADKSFRLKFGGYVQADGKTFYDDRAHLLTNNFGIRRARLNVDGTIGRFIDFRLAPEFGNGNVQLYDAYLDLKYRPYAVLRGGKFKAPLGLELLQTDTELTFVERALPSDLVPNRDEGFQVSGDFGGRLTYAVAVMNGANDGAAIDADSNDGKEVLGRIFATPFAKSGPAALKGLGFGIGVSTGRQNGPLPSFKSTGGQATFFSYASSASAAGRRLRYSPQLYYYNGPLGVVGEYVESSQKVAAGTGNSTVTREISNRAWQVTGSWVLTGEQKSTRGVTPKKGLDGKNGPGLGAWEVAVRYSELNVDPTAFLVKFADRAKSAEAARAWGVGLNWYLIRNAKLAFNYEQTRYQGGAALGNRPTEKALLNRLQVTF